MIYPELREIIEREGNEKDFRYRGYECHIRRVGVPYMGHLCGYIEIPPEHELFAMNYDRIEKKYDYELPVHGGLTFSGYVFNDDVNSSYWIGFDCAHSGDLAPMYLEEGLQFRLPNDTYKDMSFVENNIKQIIDFIENKKRLIHTNQPQNKLD